MRSAPVAAAPASPHRERNSPDYFEVFGLPRRFAIDRAALERRFYELSREHHPDRYGTASADRMREAVEHMSLLNDAYRTLKDPVGLRRYYLELHGFQPSSEKGQLPAVLAESWFEVQDALLDEPAQAKAKLAEFEKLLADVRDRGQDELDAVENALDAIGGVTVESTLGGELLKRLSDAVKAQSYLQSLERDVARIAGRISP